MRVNIDKLPMTEILRLPLPASVGPDAPHDAAKLATWLRLMPRIRDASQKVATASALALLLPLLREDRDTACDVVNAIIAMTSSGIRRHVGFKESDITDPRERAAYLRWKQAHTDLIALHDAALAAMATQDHPPVSDD